MANNWLGGPTSPSDPSTFNYDTAAQQVQRQRAAAQSLQQLAMTPNQGQIIKGGDFTGYAGGNTLGSTLVRVLSSLVSNTAHSSADDQQNQLSLDSQDALSYTMDPKNTPAGRRVAAALLAKSKADEAGSGEGDLPDAQVQALQVDEVSPAVNPLAQAASQALQQAPNVAPKPGPSAKPVSAESQTVSSTPRPRQSVTGGAQSFGIGGLSRALGPQISAPPSAPAVSGSMSADEIAFASKMFGGSRQPAPQRAAVSPRAAPATSGVTGPVRTAPVSAPMPPQGQAPLPQVPPTAPALQSIPTPLPTPMPQQQAQPQPQPQPLQQPQPQAAPTPDDSQPTQAEQLAQLQAMSRTGPMGQQMATAMMNSQFSREWGEIKNADGATIGVYNKRDPGQTMSFKGTNTGTKTIDAAQGLVKSTDYTNPDAMERLNQNLASIGQPPMTPQQVAGLQQTAPERATHQLEMSKAQGEVATDITTSRNTIATMQKGINDANTMIALSAKVGSRYPAGSTIAQLWSQYGHRDPDVDQLKQLYATNQLAEARDALQGQGRMTQTEIGVFKDATPNMLTSPAAVARLVGPSVALMQRKLDTEQGILSERTNRFQKLGGDPAAFGQGQAQAPMQSGASTGRAPGNYNF